MLHHVALSYAKVASALERTSPDAAAKAWMRSLAAWLVLGEEHAYLARLGEAVSGSETGRGKTASRSVAMLPKSIPLEIVADLGRRAEGTSRDLAPAGRAALLALASVGEAGLLAGLGEEVTRPAREAAERGRNAALDAALAVVGEALDEASVRGELATGGRAILVRAIDIWAWSGHDEAVEQFLAERLSAIGWELYRRRDWDGLRFAFEPFRPMLESFAVRIERDRTKSAYSASCAQMFVFMTDIEPLLVRKMELAERAVRICPTHRNGRLNLASLLCDQALASMRSMVLFVRREELETIEAALARAETLYPESTELPEAKAMLERVKRGRISL